MIKKWPSSSELIVIHLLLSLTMSLIIMLNKSQLLFKMRVAVQGLRMERNRRLLWDMTKIIFNSFMTILIFGLLIGMGKITFERIIPAIR